ncbi:lebercilin [Cyprinodon tularosa]|uniref:lebercilin n=1 Tax=Cyprinodon tularosa TaxID=77115 RepID=UPI0018E2729E|nr:lebercilin [Cyprinodon tularosa]XP_038148597.1 lebercilin [Cyprinodon tularosa]XP_038148598.1 lebercilin [Cyprinodon tularosa]XP_038148599.1 lebercilin [Cyprinodon tularosa]
MGFNTPYQIDNMEESEKAPEVTEDNRILSCQSRRSTKKESRASSMQMHRKNCREKNPSNKEKDGRAETRSDPDRDRISDAEGRRSEGSLYSEDYENATQSERSLSPFSRSLTPSPTPQRGFRAKQISRSPLHKTRGVGRWSANRLQRPGGLNVTQQHRKGNRSISKESTPHKDLDLVTKRMLSARLLKINELRNSLAELQQQNDELKKENRVLRQLQVRQEKALQRYDDTESEISQLLARHSNEMQVLRERLRRTQERERKAERRLKETEEQLQRNQAAMTRLKKLVDQQELGTRDELSRSLEEEKTRAQEAQRRVKDLERSIELSNNSFQRQLAAEKKKTISSQEEVKSLLEELDQLTKKLKEKERELDAKNIYSNRMVKPTSQKDTDISAKRKLLSRNSTKAVQTEDTMSSPDFPSPPPAINEYIGQAADEYLSLKELDRADGTAEADKEAHKRDQQKKRERHKDHLVNETEQETQQREGLDSGLGALEEKPNTLKNEKEKRKNEEKGEIRKSDSLFSQNEDDIYWKHGRVQETVARLNKESTPSQEAAEEARRKKEQLLARMREIDRQNQGAQDSMFFESFLSDSKKVVNNLPTPHPPEERNHNSSGVLGRRVLRSQTSSDDLAFGRYAPSFGHSTSRIPSGFSTAPPKETNKPTLEAIGIFNLGGVVTEKETEKREEKDKKASLMQQLFGAQASPAGSSLGSNKMEVLNSPSVTNGVRSRREGLHRLSSGSSTPTASYMMDNNVLHVTDSKPAVRAIPSYDDDIEELAL